MKTGWSARALLLLAACSDDDAVVAPPPSACLRTDRHGTYVTHFQRIGGTCPDVGDSVVNLDAPFDPGGATEDAKCETKSDVWSDNDCKSDRVIQCKLKDSDVEYTLTTRQQTQDGSKISGTYGVRLTLHDGNSCQGSYNISYSRQ